MNSLARACLFFALLLGSALPGRAQEAPASRFSESRFLELFAPAQAAASSGISATLPPGFYLETVATGLDTPVNAEFAADGRMLVVEKRGRLYIVENGARRLLLDLSDEVLDQGDRGLLGLALDPNFAINGYLFLLYTVSTDGTDTERTSAFARLTRYTLGGDGTVSPASRLVLIGQDFASGIPACYYSHSPATLAFGSDGTLLVGTGDAANYATFDTGGLYDECFGPGRFPASEDIGAFRSQLLTSLAGKILRIDHLTGKGLPSNPFFTGSTSDNASKVWALGFRNPFRFTVETRYGSHNPADGNPGLIYYADVGWARWEEVGVVRRGENHGWPCMEGHGAQLDYPHTPRGNSVCPSVTASAAAPSFAWNHDDPAASVPAGRIGLATVGGAVYRGTRYPAGYRDRMFYADYPTGWLASAAVAADGSLSGDALFSADTGPVVDLTYDPSTQTLALVNVAEGTVQRLRHTAEPGNAAPIAQAGASVRQGGVPLAVQFSGSASFDPNGDALSYAWAFGDGATSTHADPLHTYLAVGTYPAVLTVTDGFGASGSASVEITVRQGTAPTAAITSPVEGGSVLSGQTISLTSAVFDPDQSAESLQTAWRITLVHDTHQHPDAFSATGPTASYTVPFHGSDEEFYSLLIRFTVTDEQGLTATAERLVFIGTVGEVDVTTHGTPVALITNPTGPGNRSLDVIKDGVAPLPTTTPTDPLLQYDTFNGGDPRPTDWIGYTYVSPITFGRLRLTEGIHFPTGGWFGTLGVQVRQGSQWTNAANVVVAPAYRGNDGQSFDTYDIVFQPLTGTGIRLIGAPGGSLGFISVAELRAFSSGTGGNGPLPVDWASADIGTVGAAGSAGYTSGTYTVRGGGDIWGDFDGFHYVSRTLVGDGMISARLSSLAGAHPWAKAGLMIRDGAAGGAPHAMLIGTATNGVHLQYRTQTGGDTEWQPGPASPLPTWLRLQRLGSTLTGFVSDDGQAWTEIGSTSVPMGAPVSIGLVTTSTDFGDRLDLATATFTDVEAVALNGGSLPTPDEAGPGAAPTFEILAVFPNPAADRALVRLGLSEPGVYRVVVVDVLGRTVFERSLREDVPAVRDIPVDLSGHSAGLYVLRVEQEGGAVVTGRVTVAR